MEYAFGDTTEITQCPSEATTFPFYSIDEHIFLELQRPSADAILKYSQSA